MDPSRPPHALAPPDLGIDGTAALVFQPTVDLGTGRLLGFEALLRWIVPGRGPIMPDAFVPWAEAGGHMGELTAWVFSEACVQAVRWGPGHLVTVNCSALQIRRGEVVAAAAAALDATGLPPASLAIDVAQASLPELAPADTGSLIRLGVWLTLDDVSSDASLLEDLAQTAVTTVKIDRSLVRVLESPAAPSGRARVAAIADRCTSLGIGTVAEGVETTGQVAILRELGIDAAQGYFFSRPVTAEEAVLLATALPRRTYAFTRDAGRPLPALDGARALDPVVGAGAARPAGPARPPGPMPPPSAADRVTLDPPATSASPPLWASEPTSTEPAPSPPPFEQLVAELAVMNHRLRELAAAVELLARSPLLQGERAAGDPDRLHP